jgi:7,8-dihydropterin-6-yl-methyl-4-(beta-D-ribofuranosyl)aminobenzene 5'-phosphate synthase
MEIISLVENTGLLNRKDLRTEDGLSLFILSKDQQILFDTGISGNFHLNAQKLNVNIAKVTHSVISHHHFDHGGGLLTFLKANHQAKVYLRNSSTEQFYFDIFGLITQRSLNSNPKTEMGIYLRHASTRHQLHRSPHRVGQ